MAPGTRSPGPARTIKRAWSRQSWMAGEKSLSRAERRGRRPSLPRGKFGSEKITSENGIACLALDGTYQRLTRRPANRFLSLAWGDFGMIVQGERSVSDWASRCPVFRHVEKAGRLCHSLSTVGIAVFNRGRRRWPFPDELQPAHKGSKAKRLGIVGFHGKLRRNTLSRVYRRSHQTVPGSR